MSSIRESINTKKNIIIIGDFGSGKTSLLHRFIKKEFTKNFINTTLDFHSYEMKHKDDTLHVFLWDSLGHERFQSMTDSFYKKAEGVILVFDITDDKNVKTVRDWLETVADKCSQNIPVIIVGNKKDICTIHEKKIKEVSDSILKSDNVIKTTTASARTGDNVDDVFKKIIIAVFENAISQKESNNMVPQEILVDNKECCYVL